MPGRTSPDLRAVQTLTTMHCVVGDTITRSGLSASGISWSNRTTFGSVRLRRALNCRRDHRRPGVFSHPPTSLCNLAFFNHLAKGSVVGLTALLCSRSIAKADMPHEMDVRNDAKCFVAPPHLGVAEGFVQPMPIARAMARRSVASCALRGSKVSCGATLTASPVVIRSSAMKRVGHRRNALLLEAW